MDHRGTRYGKVRINYLVNTMRNSYGGLLDIQKIIRLRKTNNKSLEAKAINS